MEHPCYRNLSVAVLRKQLLYLPRLLLAVRHYLNGFAHYRVRIRPVVVISGRTEKEVGDSHVSTQAGVDERDLTCPVFQEECSRGPID